MTSDQYNTLTRTLADIGILLAILLFPWWASCLAVIAGAVFFETYYEVLLFGFLLDSLYSPASGFSHYAFTLTGFVVFISEIVLKERLRM